VARYDDLNALGELASAVEVVTTEFENVPAATLEWLAQRVVCRPGAQAVATAQDRIAEKSFLRNTGLLTADFDPVRTEADLKSAWARLGAPALLNQLASRR
jgi:5-(carboxyamino)imidazole ribonucleotide synthase